MTDVFCQKSVFVLGLGITGLGIANALKRWRAHVQVWDDCQERCRQVQGDYEICDFRNRSWKSDDLLVCSPGFSESHEIILQARQANISVVADIECFFRAYPHARVIGVTGSQGKSTTASLIAHVLKESGHSVSLSGNIGKSVFDLPEAVYQDTEHIFVFELSSAQLLRTTSLNLWIGALVNLSPNHLDFHTTYSQYIAAKKRIFSCGATRGVIGINGPETQALFQEKPQLLPVSTKNTLGPGICVVDGELFDFVHSTQATLPMMPFLQGAHNQENFAIAYGVLRMAGVDVQSIMTHAPTFKGIRHRQENVGQYRHITFVNDSKATTPESASVALRRFGPGQKVFWILGGQPKVDNLDAVQPYFAFVSHAYVLGEARALYTKILSQASVPHTVCENLQQACDHAVTDAKGPAASVILLSPACASFDQFSSFEHRGDTFCQHVQDRWLARV